MAVDSLSHCLRLYPDSIALVRDDATTDGTYRELERFAEKHAPRVLLERNSQSNGYLGVSFSLFDAYSSLWNQCPEIDLIVKIDPDCCILRSGLVELAERKFAEAGPGLLGLPGYPGG